jgi:5-phospho-D-xylono-1,4-lactonase
VSQVRTVLGDVPAVELGRTYMHEHLIIDSPLVADRMAHIHLASVEDAVAEVGSCRVAGVGAMVDAMPCASGRDVVRLAEISRRTGVHLVAVTGLHTAKYYPGQPWVREADADALAALFRADIDEGIDAWDYTGPVVRRTSHRAGMVKVATTGPIPDAAERRSFEAAAQVVHATGAPLLTHCEDGAGGLAQVELLRALDVPLGRVVLSHTDKRPDPGYHRELLASGVNLEYDQALRQPLDELKGSAWLLARMLEQGFGSQLLLGTDGARRSLWHVHGGSPGLAWLAGGYPAVLRRHGVEEADIERIFAANPARVLTLAPGEDTRPLGAGQLGD